jgi:hypothetical protein
MSNKVENTQNISHSQVTANQKNLLELTSETNYSYMILPNKCMDTLFPYDRYGPALTTYNDELILYGGYSNNVKRPISQHPMSFFHQYNP